MSPDIYSVRIFMELLRCGERIANRLGTPSPRLLNRSFLVMCILLPSVTLEEYGKRRLDSRVPWYWKKVSKRYVLMD